MTASHSRPRRTSSSPSRSPRSFSASGKRSGFVRPRLNNVTSWPRARAQATTARPRNFVPPRTSSLIAPRARHHPSRRPSASVPGQGPSAVHGLWNPSGPTGVPSTVPMACSRLSAYLLAIAVGAALCAGCSDGSSSPSPTATPRTALPLADLRQHPLHIENLEAGEACPALRPHDLSPAFAPGLGDGPVYPVGFSRRGVLRFSYPPEKNSLFAGSDWGGQKVLWVSDPKYDGPILIRGRQVDGTNGLRFGRDGPRLLRSWPSGPTTQTTGRAVGGTSPPTRASGGRGATHTRWTALASVTRSSSAPRSGPPRR
jgi:hypothetical protein